MPTSTLTLSTGDGARLFVYRWLPDAIPAKAIVQVAHGLAEHAGRYARLALALNGAGYAVSAHDLRGHGRSAQAPADLGFFAARDGWRRCLDDLWQVNRRLAADQPGLPILLIGHSMGSLMAQQLISEHGEALAGAVLSGPSGKPSPLAAVGRGIARLERWRLGPKGHSPLLHAFSFGAFNKQFAPARTPFDWLSRDTGEVDKYITDPLCGFAAGTQLWRRRQSSLLPAGSPGEVY